MRELVDGLVKLSIPFVFITRKAFKELPDIEKISDTGTIYRIKSGEEKLIDKNTLKIPTCKRCVRIEALSQIILCI